MQTPCFIKRFFNRTLFALFIAAFLPAATQAQQTQTDDRKIWIESKTALHSANWIWKEEAFVKIIDEDGNEVDDKPSVPNDLKRTTIGIGELVELKLKEKAGSNFGGDKSQAHWEIIEGGGPEGRTAGLLLK